MSDVNKHNGDMDTIPDAWLAFPKSVMYFGRFRRYMRYMAARYNGPVYLCGSALWKDKPRDVDFRVEVADTEFCYRYGYDHYRDWGRYGPNQLWIDDMAKRCAELATDYRINPDFQVYPVSHCLSYRKEARLLFAAPTGYIKHLADSTEWWDTPDYCCHL